MVQDRKMVQTEGPSISLDGETLGGAIKQLQKLMSEYGAGAMISSAIEPYSDSDKEHLYVVIERLENDDELAARVAQEARYQMLRDQHDEREYARLQAKFKPTEK